MDLKISSIVWKDILHELLSDTLGVASSLTGTSVVRLALGGVIRDVARNPGGWATIKLNRPSSWIADVDLVHISAGVPPVVW